MGRPIEITDEDVIRAGNALLAENRAVNGTRLWRGVGEHGRPERLLAVWTAHAEASTTVSNEPSSPVAALPEIALRLLSNCKEQLGAGLDACFREVYAAMERTLVTRFQTEMAAMTTSRESHETELREAWQALSDLAEKHQKTVLQVQDGERDVVIARATLKAERTVLSRVEADKAALSARIDSLTADLAATSRLARAAEMARVRAETSGEGARAELRAAQAAMDAMRSANSNLEREVSATQKACQLHEVQLQRQAGEIQDLRTELADARERQLGHATRTAGAERAVQALERVIAANAGHRTTGSNPSRVRRRLKPASQTEALGPSTGRSAGPGADDDDLAPRLAA